jgi:hypothetical protein
MFSSFLPPADSREPPPEGRTPLPADRPSASRSRAGHGTRLFRDIFLREVRGGGGEARTVARRATTCCQMSLGCRKAGAVQPARPPGVTLPRPARYLRARLARDGGDLLVNPGASRHNSVVPSRDAGVDRGVTTVRTGGTKPACPSPGVRHPGDAVGVFPARACVLELRAARRSPCCRAAVRASSSAPPRASRAGGRPVEVRSGRGKRGKKRLVSHAEVCVASRVFLRFPPGCL